ncbi:hypothetical protein [Methylobacterium sp. E-066]|uniref:hypothetical protein n=1 Tax=Methylobacterium sp. E-066 TaxID=2836584 RepID=UPI001FBA2C01|nr:hypothetical protein [Methylobacterium sp. E-066]MCJ2139666.1 hypothetical protein [Methylobacterium sp. E-066]
MTIWRARQWVVLRQELALAIIAAGLIANVALIVLVGRMAAVELGHMLVFVADRLR